jgi:hypothetical protein
MEDRDRNIEDEIEEFDIMESEIMEICNQTVD